MAHVQKFNITIHQGADEVIAGDSPALDENGVPIDFTAVGARLEFQVARTHGATALIHKQLSDAGVSGDANGVWSVDVTRAETVALDHRRRYYGTVWGMAADERWYPLANGTITVEGTVHADTPA